MKLRELRRKLTVAAPLDEVFPFFEQPENLAAITPPSLGFEILTPTPVAMKEGAVVDYVVRVSGLPTRWRTLITTYEPPFRFVDEQILGPYSFWHHTHTFRPASGGGTELGDVVRYVLPLGPLGDLAHALVVRRQLRGIFEFRRRVLIERFGAVEARS